MSFTIYQSYPSVNTNIQPLTSLPEPSTSVNTEDATINDPARVKLTSTVVTSSSISLAIYPKTGEIEDYH